MAILMPQAKLETVGIYVDEVYLARESGVIRAGLAVPEGAKREFEGLLNRELPDWRHSEFKGSKIGHRRYKKTHRFLQCVRELICAVSTDDVRPGLITVESSDVVLNDRVKSRLDGYGKILLQFMTDSELLREYTILEFWTIRHLCTMMPNPISNPLEFYFDERFRNDQRAKQIRFFLAANGVAVGRREDESLAIFMGSALHHFRPNIAAPRVTRVTFVRSREDVYVQIVDLLANLMLNNLLYHSGIRTELTQMKRDLLATVADIAVPPDSLLKRMRPVKTKDGQDSLRCEPNTVFNVRLRRPT